MLHLINEGGNSALRNTIFPLGKDIRAHLKDILANYSGSKGDAGYDRLNNIIRMDAKQGGLNYNEMVQLKNVFSKIDRLSKEYQIIGGDMMKNWVEVALNGRVERDHEDKAARRAAGQKNVYIKPHTKDKSAERKTEASKNGVGKPKLQTKNASASISTNEFVKINETKMKNTKHTIILTEEQAKFLHK